MRRIVCAALLGLIPTIASGEPLLWYNFNEASGNALDTGDAPPADATLLGGATRSSNTPSGFGSSLDLRDDATTYKYALEGDANKLDGLGALTLTTWLNVEAYTSGNNRLAAKQAAGTFGGFNWSMNATPNTGTVGPDNFRLGLFLGNNISSGPADFTFAFSTDDVDAHNKWVFLAVTYDSSQASNNTKFYIGGVNTPVTQLGSDLTLAQLSVDGGASLFGVGYTDAAPTADTSVIGFQDDVRVYGRALSATELEDVRFAGTIPEPGSMMLVLIAGLAWYCRLVR
ncbi:MAG: LamG-like jellyroll fold domain-containing protein [Pirellulales bacterium]